MTSLQKYELLILTVPEVTQDETKDIEKQVNTLVKKYKGSVVSFDRWGKHRLAYPVKKNDYGVYFLARFDAPTNKDLNGDIESVFKIRFDNIIVRSVLTALAADAPADYKRPRSLEETPANTTGSILKNKKVEGLISAVDATTRGKDEDEVLDDMFEEETDDSTSVEA